MRTWFLPYGFLDGQRLRGQHNECHGLMTCVMQGTPWGSITRDLKGHEYFLAVVHQWILDESRLRGPVAEVHPSPVKASFLEAFPREGYNPYPITNELLINDIKQLREKWEREQYYFGMGRLDLRLLEKHHDLPIGRSPASAARCQLAIRVYVKEHSKYLRTMKGTMGTKLDLLRTGT